MKTPFADGFLTETDRSTAFWMGIPAILLAAGGMILLLIAEFVMADSLENRYKALVEDSTETRIEAISELQNEIKMLQETSRTSADQTLNDLIPEDDETRVKLKEASEEQRIYLRKLNALNPREPEYLFKLGKATIEKGDVPSGLAMIRKIAPLDEAGYLPGHLFLAQYYLRLKVPSLDLARRNANLSLKHIDNALKRDDSNIEVNRLKASLLVQMGGVDNQREAYDMFVKIFDAQPSVYRAMIEINRKLNRESENPLVLFNAIDAFKKQLGNSEIATNGHLIAIRELVNCYKLQEDYQAAESLLKSKLKEYQALENSDSEQLLLKSELAILFLAWTSQVEGNDLASDQRRLEYLTEAYKYDPTNESALVGLTRLSFSEHGEIAETVKDIYAPLEDPNPPAGVLNALGVTALSNAEYNEALKYFNEARNKSPTNPEYLNNLAYTHLKADPARPRLALQQIDEAFERARKNLPPRVESSFLDTRARAFMALEMYDKAIADFRRAHLGRPENQNIIESLIECYRLNDLQTEAEVWSRKLEELKQQSAAEAGSSNDGQTP